MNTATLTALTVRFVWSESAHVDCSRIFHSISAASAHLWQASCCAPDDGGYHKTQFEIVATYGGTECRYQGRIDLEAFNSATTDLAHHIAEHCQWVVEAAPDWIRRGLWTAEQARERGRAAIEWQRIVIDAVMADRDARSLRPTIATADDAGQLAWGF